MTNRIYDLMLSYTRLSVYVVKQILYIKSNMNLI